LRRVYDRALYVYKNVFYLFQKLPQINVVSHDRFKHASVCCFY